MLPGIAAYLLHNGIGMSAEEIARKLKMPVMYARLLIIETERSLAEHRDPLGNLRVKITKIERILTKPPGRKKKKKRSIRLITIPKKLNIVLVPIDEDVGMETVRRIAPLFHSSAPDVRGERAQDLREARWARMTAMTFLHCVVTPPAEIPAIAHFFNMVPGTVFNALKTIENCATSSEPHMFKRAIYDACGLYGVEPSALRFRRKSDGPAIS